VHDHIQTEWAQYLLENCAQPSSLSYSPSAGVIPPELAKNERASYVMVAAGETRLASRQPSLCKQLLMYYS